MVTMGFLVVTVATGATPSRVLPDPGYQIDTWETEDGLPENSSTAMAQTPDGYLWFGTFNGLVRFDGVTFSVLDPANTPELPSAAIVNLHGDPQGRLWVSTDRGLCLFAEQRWRTFGAGDGWVGNYVRTFAGRPNGDLLCTTFDGRIVEFTGGRFRALPAPPGEPGHGYFAHVDEAGQWWVVQNRFAGRWDGQRWIETIPLEEPIADAVGAGTARDGGLLLVVGTRLRRWRQGSEVEPVLLPESPGSVWSVSEDSNGNVWICTYTKGLCRIRPDGTFQRWSVERGFSCDSTRFVFEDRERNLWVGTSGGGLMRFKSRRFQVFGAESAIAERGVRSVSPRAEGGMWIATFGGGLFHRSPDYSVRVPLPGFASTIVYGQAVLQDRAGRTWFGAFERGLWQIEAQGTRKLPPEQTGGATISLLFEDSRGRVWIGGDRALACFDDGVFRGLPAPTENRLAGVVGMAEDHAGVLWLSNQEGVFRLQPDGLAEVFDQSGRPLRDVLCFRLNPDGSAWLGTRNKGLLRWGPGKWAHLDAAVGFPAPGVHAILEDDRGNFWMPSKRGVVRASRAALEAAADGGALGQSCQLLGTSDGLVSVECPAGLQPTCARDAQGRFWFATMKGVAMTDPAGFRLNTLPPPVHIEAVTYRFLDPGAGRGLVSAMNPGTSVGASLDSPAREQPPRDLTGLLARRIPAPFPQPLRFPAGSHRIEIRYAATSLVAPEKVRFQVKLERRDLDWRDAGHSRLASFEELAPGDYVFRVRAANDDGVWNETGASLGFTVLPHYWQTGWFQLGVALLLAGLGGGVVWIQSRSHLRRATEKERAAHEIRELAGRLINAQEEERRRIARELHDDFSQSLALLSVEMELLGAAAPEASPPGAPQMAGMAARVKELSSEVHRLAYELHPAKLDQLGLVAAARGYCREVGRQSGLRIEFEAADFPRQIPDDLALCFYRILQEALQNAIRHSGAHEARVKLWTEADRVCLLVTDAGRGFDVARARREGGLGLSSMQERVRLVNGTLSVKSEPGRGTTIAVQVAWTNAGGEG